VVGQRIIESVFFYNRVNLEHYVNSILEQFFQKLTEEEMEHAYFQQNNATAHTSELSV
jgi:hypothetical protein